MADIVSPHAELSTPSRSSRPVQIWLLAVAALVIAMVSVGGATRLTGSGLSITEWKPIMGAVPPLTDANWHEAFEKYKAIPQYTHVNRGMSLDGFKAIFWWEWGHRFLARLVGFAFLLPFLGLLAAGYIRRAEVPRMLGLFALGGLQGVIGWYMVASGLSERVSVSQYRLALHLGLAFIILGALVWTALDLNEEDERRLPSRAFRGGLLLVALAFLQVELGALVAGMKAGLAYNTWPLMDGALVPTGLGIMQPWYLNPFENAMTVQFDHRVVAYLLTAFTAWHLSRVLSTQADRGVRISGALLGAVVLVQILLGIWTLLAQVPLALGLAHQLGAAILFAIAVWHAHALKTVR